MKGAMVCLLVAIYGKVCVSTAPSLLGKEKPEVIFRVETSHWIMEACLPNSAGFLWDFFLGEYSQIIVDLEWRRSRHNFLAVFAKWNPMIALCFNWIISSITYFWYCVGVNDLIPVHGVSFKPQALSWEPAEPSMSHKPIQPRAELLPFILWETTPLTLHQNGNNNHSEQEKKFWGTKCHNDG